MTDIAIRVENLSKQYRIGGPQARYKTIRESLTEAVGAPFRRLSSVLRGQSSAVSNETIWALKDVSFEVQRGEVVGIIGRNGAGKSTLLKILSHIAEPTSGRVEIRGRVSSLLEVGTGFHPELTGRENIYLNGTILGMKKAEVDRKFDEIVDFSGVEKFMDTPVKHYSSGMYVRLAFAVAAHLEPEVLLVDEVLAVGDAAFQKKCLGKMGDVAREGRTVLFVSHNMPAVMNLCERAIHLEIGRIVNSGISAEVVNEYLRSTVEHHASTSILDTQLRSGTGIVRIKNIQLFDTDGTPTTTFYCGSPVRMKLDFDLGNLKECSGVVVGVTFRDYEDRPIFICRTDFQSSVIDTLKADRPLECVIPKLPLYPGDYLITAAILKDNILADLLERVAQIHVAPGDFYGSGRLSTSTKAQTLVIHEWKEL